MQSYMERRLVGLHDAGTESHLKERLIVFAVGFLVIAALPFIHLGLFYYIWAPDKPTIDRAKCSCNCFDTVFRGRYEWPPSSYKHIYFNSTSNTLCVWLLIVGGILAFYECIRYLIPLVVQKRFRLGMIILFLSSLYPHYYGWWGFFNYLNEDFYYQWNHQVFFSLTELLSTVVVIHLCNSDNRVESWKLLVIFNINLMHVIVSGLDQFIGNVLYRGGQHFEAIRDFGLMMPDVFHVLLSFFEMQILAEKRQTSLLRLFYREEILMSVVMVTLFSLLGKHL